MFRNLKPLESLPAIFQRVRDSVVLRNAAIITVGNVIANLIGIITSVVIVRGLESISYGILILAQTMVTTVLRFVSIRGSEVLVRFILRELNNSNPRKIMAFVLVGVSSDFLLTATSVGLVWFGVLPLASGYPNAAILQPLIRIFMLSIPFSFLTSTPNCILIAVKQFRLQSFVSTVGQVSKLIMILLFITQGLEALVWVLVAASAIEFSLLLVVTIRIIYQRFGTLRIDGYWNAWREFIPFTFSTSVVASLQAIYGSVDTWLLGLFGTVRSVGFVNIATSATSLMVLPVRPIGQAIYPGMIKAWLDGDMGRVRTLIWRFMALSTLLSTAEVIALGLLANWLVNLIYGAEYQSVAQLISIIMFGQFLENLFPWVRSTATAAGKPNIIILPAILLTILRIIVMLGFIYHAGAYGAALAYLVSACLFVIVTHLYTLPKLGISNYLSSAFSQRSEQAEI